MPEEIIFAPSGSATAILSSKPDAKAIRRYSIKTSSSEDLVALVRACEPVLNSFAKDRQIDPLTLRTQVLLHLPRLIKDENRLQVRDVMSEAERISTLLSELQRPYTSWLEAPENEIELDDLEFVRLDYERAKVFHEVFHYVGSFRPGLHFALVIRGTDKVVCMGSFAEFDMMHCAEKISPHIDLDSVMTDTRFFAFRWAPENAFSHFFALASEYLRKARGAELFFTFINPNIGFSGSSHIGSQMRLFAKEEGTQYMYVGGRYVTMRYLVQRYGTNDIVRLKEILGDALEVSNIELQPLHILACAKTPEARAAIPSEPYLFSRPKLSN